MPKEKEVVGFFLISFCLFCYTIFSQAFFYFHYVVPFFMENFANLCYEINFILILSLYLSFFHYVKIKEKKIAKLKFFNFFFNENIITKLLSKDFPY